MVKTYTTGCTIEGFTAIVRDVETATLVVIVSATGSDRDAVSILGGDPYRVHTVHNVLTSFPTVTAVSALPQPWTTANEHYILICRMHGYAVYRAAEVVLWGTWLPTHSVVGCLEHYTRLGSAIECGTVTQGHSNAEHAHLGVLALYLAVLLFICPVGSNVAPQERITLGIGFSHAAVH